MNNHVTVLEIDSNALLHNLNYFKQKIKPETKILAVVKAFGYGSDGVQVAQFLEDKVDYFAVAYTQEGVALRQSKIKTPILVLHPQIPNLQTIVDYRLEPNLYNFKIFNAFLTLADEMPLMNYPIHLKFNTGLNRLGFWHTDIPKILTDLNGFNHVKVQSIFSHLAASEDLEEKEFSINQLNNFAYIAQQFYKHLGYEPLLHILNTSGVVNYVKAQFDMVRVGIGLYGFGNDEKETAQLKNTHNLKSIISQIHLIQPGETVGYNRAFVAKSPTKSATIPVGHADGLSRKLGNKKGYVLINNQKAKIIGNVCMDMIMVDVTKIDCKEGDEVIIFNNQKMIQHIADVSETIVYETLTAISQRVKKVLN
ncbi:alanine racemase [Polaribacter reichenbachii]|uniref:Alanine racemase n=1 Tax=Polaribacter reichenbachii TaxID=996801 RepID=A0A1B8U6A4_9FLAO|nr:alanine racemase [Polaribacter reichenbachii]APZ46165.1 alanine racemase [Polaribacter reichenbachii]AUC20027.1 alanine racemase [Polaribacter reichenbachii]OBY67426.1 alanine racemase [Polaribacter reichenbachii]